MAIKFDGLIKRSEFLCIDASLIVRKEGFNPRFDFGDLEELEQSILQRGFQKHRPLVVRRIEGGKFQLRGRGDRRLTVVENMLKKGHKFPEGIPVVIEDKDISDTEALILDLVDNQGKALLPLEEAAAYKRLQESGMTIQEICKACGKSDMHVCDTLKLVQADESVRTALAENKIGTTLAKKIAIKAKGDKSKQKELVTRAAKSKEEAKAVSAELDAVRSKTTRRRLTIEDHADTKSVTVLKPAELEKKLAEVLNTMAPLVESLGLTEDNIRNFIGESEEKQAAYQFGVLLALRCALGYQVELV